LDSGSTDNRVPLNDINAILSMIPASSNCAFDSTSARIKCTCTSAATGTPTFANTEAAKNAYISGVVSVGSNVKRFPDLEIRLGSTNEQVKLTMQALSWMYYDPASATGITDAATNANQACYSKFKYYSAIGIYDNYWKLGMPVYQTFEITHDMDLQKVGFKEEPLGYGTVSGVAL